MAARGDHAGAPAAGSSAGSRPTPARAAGAAGHAAGDRGRPRRHVGGGRDGGGGDTSRQRKARTRREEAHGGRRVPFPPGPPPSPRTTPRVGAAADTKGDGQRPTWGHPPPGRWPMTWGATRSDRAQSGLGGGGEPRTTTAHTVTRSAARRGELTATATRRTVPWDGRGYEQKCTQAVKVDLVAAERSIRLLDWINETRLLFRIQLSIELTSDRNNIFVYK